MSKIENEIREQFSHKTIQPSASAWQKLEGQLDSLSKKDNQPNKKKTKRLFPYFIVSGIAACLALLWIILFSNSNNLEPNLPNENPQGVVIQNDIQPKEKPAKIEFKESVNDNKILNEEYESERLASINTNSKVEKNVKVEINKNEEPKTLEKAEIIVRNEPSSDDSNLELENYVATNLNDLQTQDSVQENTNKLALEVKETEKLEKVNQASPAVKSYVDQELLLFSVENRKLINQDVKVLGQNSLPQVKVKVKSVKKKK